MRVAAAEIRKLISINRLDTKRRYEEFCIEFRRVKGYTLPRYETVLKKVKEFGWKWENRNRHSLDEWVSFARTLATKQGGKIPMQVWLIRNGLSGLNRMLHTYPEFFQDIPQDRGYTRRKDYPSREELDRIVRRYKVTCLNKYLKLKSSHPEYRLAANPAKVYGVPLKDLFSTHRMYCSYSEFVKWVRHNKIKTKEEFHNTKRPDHIHCNPREYYAKQWKGWGVTTGTNRALASFEESTLKLERLAIRSGGLLPPDMHIKKVDKQLWSVLQHHRARLLHIPQKVCTGNRWHGSTLVAVRGGGKRGREIAKKLGVKYEKA